MGIVENKYCIEKDDYVKRWQAATPKESDFIAKKRSRFIFIHLTPKKSLKTFITEYIVAVKFVIS